MIVLDPLKRRRAYGACNCENVPVDVRKIQPEFIQWLMASDPSVFMTITPVDVNEGCFSQDQGKCSVFRLQRIGKPNAPTRIRWR